VTPTGERARFASRLTTSAAIHVAVVAALAASGPWATHALHRGHDATIRVAGVEQPARFPECVEPERPLAATEPAEPELVEAELPPPAPRDAAPLEATRADWGRVFHALPLDLSFAPPAHPEPASAASPDPSAEPQVVYAPPPVYPHHALRRRWQGSVLCSLTVRPDGTVARAEVLESSGHPTLDRATLEALRRWRFRAVSDRAGPREVLRRISFQLLAG
jgi:protein TonB